MLESDADLSIRDLAEQAGTTVRTIHYYIGEGLLPPPRGTTRNASYSPAHLARLRLIAALRDEGLALASIRQRLAPLTDEQVLEVAATVDEHLSTSGEVPLTTLGLIEAALASSSMLDSDATAPVRPPLSSPNRSVVEGVDDVDQGRGSAGDYLNRTMRNPASPRPVKPTSMPSVQMPPRKPRDSDRPEAWYHIRIGDGIELRVREDRYRESKGRLRAVVDTLRASLRRYGLSNAERDEE